MTNQRHITVGDLTIGNDLPLTLIAGPCAMESRQHALETSLALKEFADELGFGLIYKSSFDKANRTSVGSFRGPGIVEGCRILGEISKELKIPVTTDIHTAEQAEIAAENIDLLQIPAFLCRQTDLLEAAAKTGRVVNVKKGQFLAPLDTINIADKMRSFGCERFLITERGTTFGYNNLVVDMRSLYLMAETGYPVVFDATHSVQQPGGQGATSGGQREFVPVLARAAVAVGVAAVFLETHENPNSAPSDGPNMVLLSEFKALAETLMAFDALSKAQIRPSN